MLLTISLAILGYLFGSVSSAIVTCKLMGLPDPRTQGSNNPGATNVLRIGGKKAAAITLAGDFLKGAIPVFIARVLHADDLALALTGLGAFLGHLYPVFFGFKGGKGVATGLGVLLGWSWIALGLTAATWLLMALLFRYSSLSALIAFLMAPAYLAYTEEKRSLVAAMIVIAVFSYWRHRRNIRNLLTGQESKIGRRR